MKNNRISLTSTFVACAVLAVLLGGVGFLYYSLRNIKENITNLEENLTIAQDEESSSITLKNLLESTKNDREKIDTYFIEDEAEIVSLLERVEDLGKLLGTTPVVLIDTQGGGDANTNLSLNISIEGTFNEVYTYLLLLENFPVKAAFSSLSIRKVSDTPLLKTPQWVMRVLMNIESYKSS